ncbi:keratin, type I cytoskeletal 19-like [Aquarana catesbeiana]|uniref:keratin, type I cytoskeletal 19-like n=1 Tax=Aquarana catesbeiana TaxID=8400 RepID=UPI003CC9C6E2
MSYNTVQSPHGVYSTCGEYLGYPVYRSHKTLSEAKTNPCIAHNVPYYRIHRFYGGSGGLDIRHSSSGPKDGVGIAYGFKRNHKIRRSASHAGWTNGNLFNFDEKKTMQSLNGRLASYLENVKQLEEENVMLEEKICEWYDKNNSKVHTDFGPFLQLITDLQEQVLLVTENIASREKEISNNHIVADEFRKKQAMDFQMRTVVEKDLSEHIGILETINMERQNLSSHIQHLEEEIQHLKKTSEEEIVSLQAQLGTKVNVEVEMAPSIDLNKALSDIRKEYESLMERNLSDIESRFNEMTSELNNQMSSGIEQLQQFSNETIDLKLQKKTLEAELSAQMAMASVYNSNLMEINGDYSSQLRQLQDILDIVEHQVEEIQSKFNQLSEEYGIHENMKNYLENEIAKYNELLNGQTTEHSFWSTGEVGHQI